MCVVCVTVKVVVLKGKKLLTSLRFYAILNSARSHALGNQHKHALNLGSNFTYYTLELLVLKGRKKKDKSYAWWLRLCWVISYSYVYAL